MVDFQPQWDTWAQKLHQWQLRSAAADWIDALGPLNVLLAQGLYLGQPFLWQFFSEDGLETLANTLTDQEERRRFTAYLREESS